MTPDCDKTTQPNADAKRHDCPLSAGPCVPPRATELSIATLPGATPDTALRIKAEPGRDGYVRLEHLAHNAQLGWYVQKSFCVDRDQLGDLATSLRKADCLMPRPTAENVTAHAADNQPIPFPVPAPAPAGNDAKRQSS